MAKISLKVLLFCAGFLVAGAGAAYFSGVLDPAKERAAEMVSVAMPESSASSPADQRPDERALPGNAISEDESIKPAGRDSAASAGDIVVPSFDVLRVEPSGSMVVAGRAAPGAEVEVLSGSSVLATTQANGSGDFAAVLDKALKPGEHNIVLRGTSPDTVATSVETAIVSIPSSEDGQVVALVQEPGEPSRLITVPQARLPAPFDGNEEDQKAAGGTPKGADDASSQGNASANSGSGEEGQAGGGDPVARAETPDDRAVGTIPAAPPPGAMASEQGVAEGVSPFIEAVEIDGRKVFVAGSAQPGRLVRVYVNDILLGQADVAPEGSFLIEAERDLPAGDYIVRVDVLGDDGSTVIARAAVPFERPAGEKFAAVAGEKDKALLPSKRAGNATPGAVAAGDDGRAQRFTRLGTADREGSAVTQGQSNSADADGRQVARDVILPPLEPSQGSVIIRRGDTLWHISRRIYGQGPRYTTIYLANQKQIRDPDLIYPGQIFSVPQETEQGEKANLGAIGEQALSPNQAASSDTDS